MTWPTRIAVLIPVYNHAATLPGVISGMRAEGALHILVVDDGSTDGSGEAARQAGADRVLRVEPNQGKGHALALGLATLAQEGWTQALAIDADLQHPPSEGARLAQASCQDPACLWLGVRDMTGAPAASRFGRVWTSLWTWIACGCWPEDNQTGLRVYPLPAMTHLPIHAGRYAYEVESLVRAVWGGVQVGRLGVSVRYPQDRISHFHKVRDNARTAWAFTRLVVRRLIPWPHRQADGRSVWSALLADGLDPRRAALAGAFGGAMGVAPLPGLQLLAAAWGAMVLRLNPAVALFTSNISFGPLLPLWFSLSVLVGHALRTGETQGLWAQVEGLQAAIASQGPWAALAPLLTDWLLGSVPVMLLAAGIGGLAAGTFAVFRRRGSYG